MKIFLIIVLLLIIIILSLFAFFGGFRRITFRNEEQGGETVVCQELIGAYSQTSDVQNKIYKSLLNDRKIATTKGFCIYYDNPKEVEEDKLRSKAGCVVEGMDSMSLAQLSLNYNVMTLPVSTYLVAEFPYKGGLSVLVAIFKVYPAFEKYCKQNGIPDSPITEIYDLKSRKIIYRKPVQ